MGAGNDMVLPPIDGFALRLCWLSPEQEDDTWPWSLVKGLDDGIGECLPALLLV